MGDVMGAGLKYLTFQNGGGRWREGATLSL